MTGAKQFVKMVHIALLDILDIWEDCFMQLLHHSSSVHFWGLIPAVISVVLLFIRTYLEDKTLQRELEGYIGN